MPAARAALWQRRAHLALRPAPQRLPLNKQGSNAANLQRIASAEGGNSSDPLQPEPPRVAAARATNKDGAGVRGNRHSISPAAFRRFRRAKAASQAAGRTSGKRCEHLGRCGEEQLPRSPSVIGLRPLTAPSRREPRLGLRRHLPPVPAPWQKCAQLPRQQAPERLPLNKQGSNAANLQRVASASAEIQATHCNPSRPWSQPRAQQTRTARGSGGFDGRIHRRLSADFAGRKRPPSSGQDQSARGAPTSAAATKTISRDLPQSSDCVR